MWVMEVEDGHLAYSSDAVQLSAGSLLPSVLSEDDMSDIADRKQVLRPQGHTADPAGSLLALTGFTVS